MTELTFRQQIAITVLDKFIIAAILVAVGLYANEHFELFKNRAELVRQKAVAERDQALQRTSAKMLLVQRQLNDLYYPLYFRLAKDDAVWDAMLSKENFGRRIEEDVVLPNNREVLSLLEGHTELLFRTDEARDPALIKTILRYERHMAVYLGLRVSGDKRRPADLGVNYPADICHLVEHRVNELEETLSTLRGDKTSTHAAARLSECRQ
jgi:hypothetical protein